MKSRLLIGLLLAMSLTACGRTRPPTPTPPPPPPPVVLPNVPVRIEVFEGDPAQDHKVIGATLDLHKEGAEYDLTTDGAGNAEIRETLQGDYTLAITATGYESYSECVTVSGPTTLRASLTRKKVISPLPPIHGRVRVVSGRFVTDDGPWGWHGLSEFDLVHRVRTGDVADVTRRLDRAATNRRSVVRVFAMARNLFDLSPSQAGYDAALERVLSLAAERGIRVELVVFPDAQLVMSAEGDRRAFLERLARRYQADPRIIWQIANEPQFNGWSGATDAKLLSLAELLKSVLGHADFIVGDPADGDDVDASAETAEQAKTLARYSNIAALHSSRKGGAAPDGERLRRWVDHLEGYYDVIAEARKANGNLACVHDEPMGAASVRQVPLPTGKTYEREPNPVVHLAAAATAAMIGCGYTYHYISTQNDGVPGLDLIAQTVTRWPVDASWSYRNDTWSGSATHGFTWRGGKVRTWTNGPHAAVLAYGQTRGEITWTGGTHTRVLSVDNGEAHLDLWDVSR